MRNEIGEAYDKYRDNILNNYQSPEHLKVIIRIHPKAFVELRNEEPNIFQDDFKWYCYLGGRKTPILIERELPENTVFIIQSQRDYERIERDKLLEKFIQLFED